MHSFVQSYNLHEKKIPGHYTGKKNNLWQRIAADCSHSIILIANDKPSVADQTE
jgi:hypothetical protein